MNENVVYVGIDVDDVSYHGSALDRHTVEVLDFRCRPTLKGLVAPSSIPRRSGKSVKTDRIDAADLAEFYANGLLTITRQGYRYLRTALIEANQRGYRSANLSKDGKARRAKSPSEYVAIADRCLHRLNKKGNRLLLAGKHPNRVKVACARERVGFIWESLNRAAA